MPEGGYQNVYTDLIWLAEYGESLQMYEASVLIKEIAEKLDRKLFGLESKPS